MDYGQLWRDYGEEGMMMEGKKKSRQKRLCMPRYIPKEVRENYDYSWGAPYIWEKYFPKEKRTHPFSTFGIEDQEISYRMRRHERDIELLLKDRNSNLPLF
ncbi:MAG: hypothetical protein HC912_12545 [Saprospiraceae bacterium]|nr:hypothetical protein [Saprospiraceae bacterium]